MFSLQRIYWVFLTALLAIGAIVLITSVTVAEAPRSPDRALAAPNATNTNTGAAASGYIVLTWNDLGMHCYNRDFNDLAVLPPANTLWAQVVRVGNPPQIITTGVTVEYSFPDNTNSTSKSNFWSTNPYNGQQNAQSLFGLTAPLPADMGLAGKGLAGTMDAASDHFEAKWIPLTEYSDSNPTVRDPYQLATVIVRDATTHVELARNQVVAPVSTEMHCDTCHSDRGRGNENIATGVVEQNILTAHDQEEHTHLMANRPVLCASCHASNAIGASGQPGVPNLSKAMHSKHSGEVPNTIDGCYNCHPGPTTKCLRDVMSNLQTNPQTCINCHGSMSNVASNPQPWLNEPKCVNCHTASNYNQDQPLYRMSREHGGIYCEACHDSTHAIAPSSQPRDGLKFINLQRHHGPLDTCTVCHTSWPTGTGPHGIQPAPMRMFSFTPNHTSYPRPGVPAIYTHTLQNTGSLTDTYLLSWHSTQPLSTSVSAITPITLTAGQLSIFTVTVNLPGVGQRNTTVVTATSMLSPTLSATVTDFTLVLRPWVFLPVILR